MTSEPLNQYTEICRDAIKSSSAKLSNVQKITSAIFLLQFMFSLIAKYQKTLSGTISSKTLSRRISAEVIFLTLLNCYFCHYVTCLQI